MTYLPLLPIAVAFAAGIALAPYIYLSAYEQLAALLTCTLFAAILGRYNKSRQALLVSYLGFLLCGAMLAALENTAPAPDHIESRAQASALNIEQPLKASGWVKTPPQTRPGSYFFDLQTEYIEQDGKVIPAAGTIRVYHYPRKAQKAPLRLPYGVRTIVSLDDLRAPRNYGNPGMYDYVSAMKRRGISYTALLRDRDADLEMLPGRRGSAWRRFVFEAREAMLASIERMFPSQPQEQSILKAMLLGDDNWLSESTEEVFQRSGTYHVLVISGWNVAVFAGPLLLLLGRMRLPGWAASLIVLGAVAGFALLAQSEIPIVRASAMFVVYLVARLFFRHRELVNSLAAAALLLLTLNPMDLFDWGFQLSFMAVLTLATIAMPAAEWKLSPFRSALHNLEDAPADARFAPRQAQFRSDLRSLFRWLTRGCREKVGKRASRNQALRITALLLLVVAEALFFTTMMQLGFAIVTAQYFHRLTWSGILGNLLILPIASGIVLLGMLLVPLESLFSSAVRLAAPALGWLSMALENVAGFAAGLDALNLRTPTPPALVSGAFLLLAATVAVLLARRSKWTWAAIGGLAVWCVVLSTFRPAKVCREGRLELTAIDVGQGDSLFLCFPRGSTMLIDAGGSIPIPDSPVRRQDIGETVVSPYLWGRGVSRLDYVVLSHDHFDHMGGLEAVFENFRVNEFWMGPDATNRRMDWLRRRAVQAGARLVWPVGARSPKIPAEIDGVRIEVLSPPQGWSPLRVSNDDSIVLRLTYGNRTLLLAGDIESRMEHALGSGEAPLKSDILKVAHHGSRTSTTSEFLSRVDPVISVVSVGAFGRFGHPHPQVLERLGGGKMLYATPSSGAVTILTDGHRMEVRSFRDETTTWPRFFR